MRRILCPHCQNRKLPTSRVPKDVVVVMPCPECSELVVLFRSKALALDRRILQSGSHEERKMHIAGIIAEFLEPGLMKFAFQEPSLATEFGDDDDDDDAISLSDTDVEDDTVPISEDDVKDFARIHLRRIDDGDYFRRHLG
jgi:hypothetical protein